MKTLPYISPTSLKLFYSDRTEFYLQKLAPVGPDPFPQTKPMSVGSAFDAYVKDHISMELGFHGSLFDELFTSQVEEHNRDYARVAGRIVFDRYRETGALSNLMSLIVQSKSEIHMEREISSVVDFGIEKVPMKGKPDLLFTLPSGGQAIVDWKVNGYCAASNTSPKPGYCYLLPGGASHRGHIGKLLPGGLEISTTPFESINEEWALQLTIYGWVLGSRAPLLMIEQIVGPGNHDAPNPGCKLRVASFRGYTSASYNEQLASRIINMWRICASGHILDDLPRDQSDERCAVLDDLYRAFEGGDIEEWLRDTLRQHKGW